LKFERDFEKRLLATKSPSKHFYFNRFSWCLRALVANPALYAGSKNQGRGAF
jgi:hypothetical protein